VGDLAADGAEILRAGSAWEAGGRVVGDFDRAGTIFQSQAGGPTQVFQWLGIMTTQLFSKIVPTGLDNGCEVATIKGVVIWCSDGSLVEGGQMTAGYKVKLASLGLGGNTMEYGGGCMSSWYLHDIAEIAEHYRKELSEGVLLIDKRPAVEDNPAYAFASPMVNVDMEDGEIDRFGSRYLAEDNLIVSALKETAWGGVIHAAEIAAQVAPDKAGPLDYVPISQYVEWWRLRGAVIYRYDGAQFVAL